MIIRPVVEGTRCPSTGRIEGRANGAAWSAIEELNRKGLALPDIKNIIFNTCESRTRAVRDSNGSLVIDEQTGKPKREKTNASPILATTVYFVDGTKVTVLNSEKDSVVDAAGKVTDEARERGILYAIAKRIFSEFSRSKETGRIELKSEGFGRILKELVAGAYDQQKEEAVRKANKEAAKKAHLEREAAAKANPKKARPSLASTVAELAETVAKLSGIVAALKPAQEA